jgi:hypothetical protein
VFKALRYAFDSLTQLQRGQRPARRTSRRLHGVERLESRQLMAGVPEFSSFPEAEVTIYLDFDGHHEEVWGDVIQFEEGKVWYDVNTPVFSTDNSDDYSAVELQMIEQIWRCVAEDYAPFHVNVTTVEPAEFEFGSGLRVAIGGGHNDWLQQNHSGYSKIRSYSVGVLQNTVYVFSEDFWESNAARQIGDCASHEAGHSFGLTHQSLTVDGVEIEEYHPGDALRAPLMGDSYHSARSLWWLQPLTQYSNQDDMRLLDKPIAGESYGIEFRTDDHGGTLDTATPIGSLDAPLHGVIASNAINLEQGDDIDCFVVNLPENSLLKMWSIGVGVDGYSANLDARLEVYQVLGKFLLLVGESDPSDSLGGLVQFVGSGEYLIKVMSHGGYGDLGQYSVNIGEESIIQPFDDFFTREPLIDIVCDPLNPVEVRDLDPVRTLQIQRLDGNWLDGIVIDAKAIEESPVAEKTDADSRLDTTGELYDLALLEVLMEK